MLIAVVAPSNSCFVACHVLAVAMQLLLPPVGDAVQVLEKDGRFSRFVALLRKANLVEELRDANAPVTIFAPTNEVRS